MVASVCSLSYKCNYFCRQLVGSLWIVREHSQTTLTVLKKTHKLYFRTILRDSKELLHSCLRLCPPSPANKIIFVVNSSAVCELFMKISHNTLTVKETYSFEKFCAIQRNYFIYGCVCVQPRPQMKYVLSAIRRQSVDHSWAESDYLDCLKKLLFRTIVCDSEELLHLWLRLCPASPTNVISFVGNSSAVCGSFMSTVGLFWLCRKKLHFRAILRDSEDLFHLWLRLCPASPTNEIIFVGNLSAVCGSFKSIIILLCVKKTTFSKGVTSFMVASMSRLAHKWYNFCWLFVVRIMHEHSQNTLTV